MDFTPPTLKPVRDHASQVVCEANLSRRYAVASEYAFDNEDYYPRGTMGMAGAIQKQRRGSCW